jgi:hypothetical protein
MNAARVRTGGSYPGVLVTEPIHGQAIGWLSGVDLARRLAVTSPNPPAAPADAV